MHAHLGSETLITFSDRGDPHVSFEGISSIPDQKAPEVRGLAIAEIARANALGQQEPP